MVVRNCLTLFLLYFLFAASAFAEEQSLGEVTVEANHESSTTPSYDSTAFADVIQAKDFEGRHVTVPEVLEKVEGVQIKRFGGLDDFATISIRGSTSEQVAIYLDGIELNQGVNGTVNLNSIPMSQVERIEIYKGAAPARFNSSSIGGVVNIVTKGAGEKRQSQTSQSFGSFKTYEGTVLQSDHPDPFTYHVGYTFRHSDGDFSFLDNQGTPFNPNDDQVVKRQNNESNRHHLITKLAYEPSEGETHIQFQNQFVLENQGVPGIATISSQTAHLTNIRNGTSFEVAKNLGSQAELTFNPYFQYSKQQFSDPKGEIGFGSQESNNDTFQYGSGLRGNLLAGRHQKWFAGLEYRGEQFLPEDFALSPSSLPGSARNSVGLSIEDEISLLTDRLILNPSIRTDYIFNDFAQTTSHSLHPVSGKMGLKFLPLVSNEKLTLKTNLSRSVRVPNFTELFGDSGTLIGNPNLNEENSLNWDIGGVFNTKAMRFQVAYFLNHVDDLIQFLQTSQFTVQARNLSKARIQGVETSFAINLNDQIDLHTNYTFQLAKDISGLPGLDGKFLPGRPIHEVSSGVSYSHRLGKLFSDLTFMADNFLDTQNVLRVDNRFLWSAGFSVSPFKRVTTGFEAKNLLDNRVSDVFGFPLPGRSFYGKIQIDI